MRRLRFNLRTLGVVVAATALFLGYWNHKATQRRMLADSLRKKGGSVYWAEPSGSFLLQRISKSLPKEFCCVPVSVETVGITDAELTSIVRWFPRLQAISFDQPALENEGFEALAGLKSLTQVCVYGDGLPEFSGLALCPQLVKLDIDSTDFEDQHLARLSEIPALQMLMLFQTPVTIEGLTTIKSRMPSCEIVVFPNHHTDSSQFASLQYDPIQDRFVKIDGTTGGPVLDFSPP